MLYKKFCPGAISFVLKLKKKSKISKNYDIIIDGSDNPKSTLSFNTPGQKITKNYAKVTKSEALNSKIDWRNTRENSYDSVKLIRYLCDEAGKWTEASVEKNWQVVRSCLTLGDKIIGKCFMPSTVNELEMSGGENFKNIWF